MAVDTWSERVQFFCRQARERAGTAEKLAAMLDGVGIRSARTGEPLRGNTVQQWMRGISAPSAETLLAMAKVTNLSIDALLTEGFDSSGVPSMGEVDERLARHDRELERTVRDIERVSQAVARLERDLNGYTGRLDDLEAKDVAALDANPEAAGSAS